ncbi:hypothetical protein BMS3Bbin05_00753 [bacterium BMS3Bbin05]|nr:hypothetical protein BMS3Bbin05_00753 [bacterium BMS3Bbin05]HDL20146.1 hypothetical protein [Nitrospirota bacterium]
MEYNRSMRIAAHIVFFFVTVFFLVPPSFAADVKAIGEAIPDGYIETSSGSGHWIKVADAMPVISGTVHNYKTVDSGLSLILNDGTKIEASENTDFTVSGNSGGYPVGLTKGAITFSVPVGSSLVIKTQDYEISADNSSGSGSSAIIGSVSSDGKETVVKSLQGDINLKSADGSRETVLASGESYKSAAKEDNSKKKAAAAVGKTQSSGEVAAMTAQHGGMSVRSKVLLFGLGLGAAAAIILAASSGGGKTASPSGL